MPKKSGKERYNFLIEGEVYRDFSAICDELGLVRSKNIEIYMRKFIEEHREALKEAKK